MSIKRIENELNLNKLAAFKWNFPPIMYFCVDGRALMMIPKGTKKL